MLLPLLLALAQDSVRAAPRDTAPIAALERFIVAQLSQHAIPGLAIAVVDGDRIVWAKGFGRVDPADSTRRVTAETPFRVGSVSKLFADTGVTQRDLLASLGMSGASFAPDSAYLARRARGTMWTLDGRSFAAPTFPLGPGPTSELSASVLDLGQFLRMFFAGGVGQAPYGPGFALGELDGARRIGHSGRHYGFSTELAGLPDERLGVALSATIDGGNGVTSHIADEALRLMRAARAGRPLPSPLMTRAIPPERRRELEGTYRGRSRSVVLEDRLGDLWLDDLHGDFPALLRALDDSTFIADGRLRYGARVTLHRSARGTRTLRYAGDTLALVPDARPAAPPARWRPLIGEYGLDHDVLYLLERDGRLFALIGWFGLYPLTEVDRDHLRFPAHGLHAGETLRIDRDSAGRVRALDLGGVVFARRAIAPDEGITFRIRPRRALDELRREALAATPPAQPADRAAGELVDLTTVDARIRLDVRYATSDNFMGAPMYDRAQARLQRPAAEALGRVQRALAAEGFGLLIHDAYRPWYVTRMFWDATPDSLRVFVADPATGSRHNRGAAVDLSLYDLRTGRPVTMVSGYDEFSPRAYPFYPGGTSEQRWLRARLRRAMEREGFLVYDAEWWHFDHASWRRWAVGNVR